MVPYKAITNDVIVLENPDCLVAVLEVHVSSINDTDIMEVIHERLMKRCLEMPAGIHVSFYMTKFLIEEKLPVLGTHSKPIVNYLEKKDIEFLGSNPSPRFSLYMTLCLPLEKDSDAEFSFLKMIFKGQVQDKEAERFNKYEQCLEKLNNTIKSLIASIDGNIFRLSSPQIIQFISLLINHGFVTNYYNISSVFKSDFFSSVNGVLDSSNIGYVYYGGNYHAVLSLRNYGKESKLPPHTHAGLNRIFFHKDLTYIPFTIHHSIRFMAKSEGLARANLRKNMLTGRMGIAKKIPWLNKIPEGIEPEKLRERIESAIEYVESSDARFLEQFFHVHIWHKNLNELKGLVKSFNATINSVYKLKPEKINIKSAYYSMFPGNEHCNPITSTLPSFNVVDFMPIDLPRYCHPHKAKDFLYFKNDSEAVTKVSPFDRRADNWNSLVFGGSGSGKSFLVNSMLWQYAKYNPQIAIIDYGGAEAGSYRNLILNTHGTYLEIGFDSNIEFSINPFDGPFLDEFDKPKADKLSSLLATLENMSDERLGGFTGSLPYEITKCLSEYYRSKNNNDGNVCNLNEFTSIYFKNNQTILSLGRDLAKELFQFIGEGQEEGPYARFFKATKEPKSKDMICFDLEGLKGHPRLKRVLVACLLDMITSNILAGSDKDRKKLMVMDEAWKDLVGGSVADYMENCARTIRKLNGSITVISQSIDDIMESPIARALLVNTSYYYIVGNKHNPEPLRKLAAASSQGVNRLSEYDIQSILECQSKRDFYLLTPFFSGLLRFYPSREFIMLATTDPEDKKILRKHRELLKQDYVTPEVIDSARKEFFSR